MTTPQCTLCRKLLTTRPIQALCGCFYDEACFRNLCQLRCPACYGTDADCRLVCTDLHMSQVRRVCAKVCSAERGTCLLCGKLGSYEECTLESPCGGRFHEGCYENLAFVACVGCGRVAEDFFSWNLRAGSEGGNKLMNVMNKLELG